MRKQVEVTRPQRGQTSGGESQREGNHVKLEMSNRASPKTSSEKDQENSAGRARTRCHHARGTGWVP